MEAKLFCVLSAVIASFVVGFATHDGFLGFWAGISVLSGIKGLAIGIGEAIRAKN